MTVAAVTGALVAFGSHSGARWPGRVYRFLMAVTFTLQVYLYALNLLSNLSWGRNISGHLVAAFAPTVWSGREPFPIGPVGISVFACGTLLLMLAVVGWKIGRSSCRERV